MKDGEAPKKETALQAAIRENDELRAENKKLKHAQCEGGSLFDLKDSTLKDSTPKDIARVIVEVVISEGRLKSLQAAIAEEVKTRKARLKAQAG